MTVEGKRARRRNSVIETNEAHGTNRFPPGGFNWPEREVMLPPSSLPSTDNIITTCAVCLLIVVSSVVVLPAR